MKKTKLYYKKITLDYSDCSAVVGGKWNCRKERRKTRTLHSALKTLPSFNDFFSYIFFPQLFSHFSEKRVKNGIGRRKNPCSSVMNSRGRSLFVSTKYKTGYHHHNHIHFRCHPHHQDDNHDDQVARPVRERQGEGGKISAFRRNVYKVTMINDHPYHDDDDNEDEKCSGHNKNNDDDDIF